MPINVSQSCLAQDSAGVVETAMLDQEGLVPRNAKDSFNQYYQVNDVDQIDEKRLKMDVG